MGCLYGFCNKIERGKNHSERVGGIELEASCPLGKMLYLELNLSNWLHLINVLASFFFCLYSVISLLSSSKAVAFKPLEARCEVCLESCVMKGSGLGYLG